MKFPRFAIFTSMFVFFIGALALYVLVYLLLIKLMWGWTIPDLFPGGVSQGTVAESISWWTSFKIALFIALISSLAGVKKT